MIGSDNLIEWRNSEIFRLELASHRPQTSFVEVSKDQRQSECIPLVGAALWTSKRLLEANDDSVFAFRRYCDATGCRANAASGELNKWLHQYVPENCVIHSFRHSLRDRLRAVECPSDIIDAIGGWRTSGIGHGYGSSYPLEVLGRWLEKI